MPIVFWLSFILVVYVYLGYPALLVLWRRFAARPVRKAYWEPAVSIIIAAHNEEPECIPRFFVLNGRYDAEAQKHGLHLLKHRPIAGGQAYTKQTTARPLNRSVPLK